MQEDNTILPQVSEVAMNPSTFSAAIGTGKEERVRVGFEFEVCIPESYFHSEPDQEDYITWAQQSLKIIISNDYSYLYHDSVNDFDRYFKPNPQHRCEYKSMKEAVTELCNEAGRKFGEVWNTYIQPEDQVTLIKLANDLKDIEPIEIPENFTKEFLFATTIVNVMRGVTITGAKRRSDTYARKYSQIYPKKSSNFSVFGTMEDLVDTIVLMPFSGVVQYMFKSKLQSMAYLPEFIPIDPKAAYEYALEATGTEPGELFGPGTDDDDEDAIYLRAAEKIKDQVKKTFRKNTIVFSSYHEEDKNSTSWYIEPDGSLEPKAEDTSAEIVSPPMRADVAVKALRDFYALAKANGWYTGKEYNTGLHIGVSIPRKIDILKLAVFLGDDHIIRKFGRENNSYVSGVMKFLTGGSRNQELWQTLNLSLPDFKATMQEMAENFCEDHTASISNQGKYISFRHAGGDYLNDFEAVYHVVGRFVRAILIASDPDLYKNEYYKKLVLMQSEIKTALRPEKPSMLNIISLLKSKGLPVVTVGAIRFTSYAIQPANISQLAIREIIKQLGLELSVSNKAIGFSYSNDIKNFLKLDTNKNHLESILRIGWLTSDIGPEKIKELKRLWGNNMKLYSGTWITFNPIVLDRLFRVQIPISMIPDSSDNYKVLLAYAVQYLPPTHPKTLEAISEITTYLKGSASYLKRPESPPPRNLEYYRNRSSSGRLPE